VTKSGFTLIELMVAMVVGLTAITSVYSLGSAMSRQFYEEQRIATAQGTSRIAIMELRRDISRAGLFGSPNGNLEPTCDATIPSLPKLGGGTGPMGAFQYYADVDVAVLDPDIVNTTVHADRLRILTSLYLTDQLLVHSASIDGATIVLQAGNQAYRRTFSWGQTAGPFTSGSAPPYLDGNLAWDSAWSGETASWKGIAQKGARAFQTGSVLHIETPEGRHFFRSVFGKAGNTQDEVRMQITPALPIGTACLPGAAEGATIAPLQWVEYALVDPFDATEVGANFMDFDGMFYIDLDPAHPSFSLQNTTAADLIESRTPSPNMMLVRRVLDSTDQSVRPNSTQVVAEFVSNFQVSFVLDTTSGSAAPTLTSEITGSGAESSVNDTPERVRSVIIDLGIRSPVEDPTIAYASTTDAGTRFEVDKDQQGSARVRRMRIEIPVMNVARKNL
jgi:prepilin-type N-terminal cleavage/methylation domain-containing protein